ncbi:uncharacterized protein LOC143078615 [Mytilus galloprovincialis]|uniref:uncharacterized protein LOC143078615 n=1 Tax=Mytilus galloprovincialis TaxID=29158 RepID=UPI003F7CA24E
MTRITEIPKGIVSELAKIFESNISTHTQQTMVCPSDLMTQSSNEDTSADVNVYNKNDSGVNHHTTDQETMVCPSDLMTQSSNEDTSADVNVYNKNDSDVNHHTTDQGLDPQF